MKKQNIHVTKRDDGDWQYKRENAKRASGVARTQAIAERETKSVLSRSGGGEVVIHGLDGKIRDKDTVEPGKDPYPPKDTRH